MSSLETSCVCRGSFVCVRLPIKRRSNTINRGTLTNIADVPREKSRRTCVLLRSLPDFTRYIPTTDSPPIYPKLTNMFVLSGQFADVGRTLGLHCRCLRMFPGRVTLFTDVPSLFADVLTKPADLAIGDHRAPQSGQCKPGLRDDCTGQVLAFSQSRVSPTMFFYVFFFAGLVYVLLQL